MAENCDMLLRAAELLDHSKSSSFHAVLSSSPQDDFSVPDIIDSSMHAASPQYGDTEDSNEEYDDMDPKRPRGSMAAFKGGRFIARDAVAHNSVEKRRRAFLASCYDGLKNVVPALSGTRASNVKVLRGGVALIKSLEAEDRRLVLEKKRLIAQRDALTSQNNALAKQLFQRLEHAVPLLEAATLLGASTHPLSCPPPAAPLSGPVLSGHCHGTDNEDVAMSLMLLAQLCPGRC